MAFKKIPLTIDTMIRNPVPVEGINQEDNVELNIVVTENKTPKDLSRQTIKVYVRRIDGTLVEQTDQITPTNASEGEVTVKLKNSAFNKEGYALFQLDVSDSDGRITSSYATFKIGKGLVSGEAIANTNEVNALKQIEEYIKKANRELETFKQTVVEINENEATRQENERIRVREEVSRNEAEALRERAELERKQAEELRKEAEATREGRLKALETEVTNGRTATTGEDFNSLDERIDAEVDRINKKVEFSFMQQEDAESHKVENTIVGMTTDMVIKGKTMYKKSDGSYTDVWEENATLESFGEKESNKISILSSGKNLFNQNQFSQQLNSNGELEFLSDSNTRVNNYFYIFEEKNWDSKVILNGYDSSAKQFTTTNQEKYYILIGLNGDKKDNKIWGEINLPKNTTCFFSSTNKKGNNVVTFKDIQIEVGASKTSYEPYKQDKKDILLSFTKGLKSVNATHDEINSISKKIIQRIGERPYEMGDEDLGTVITDKTTTYYILDESVEHELSSEINVSTYDERTHVDFENTIKGTSSFKAPVNTLKTIARLSNENTRLKRDLALHAENTIATDEAITDYSLDMDYKLCLLEMELAEIKEKLGGK